MTFGISIRTGDINFEFDSNFTAYKLEGAFNTRSLFNRGYINRDSWVSTGVRVPDGYDFLLMFSRGDCYMNYSGSWGGKTYAQPTACYINQTLNENREICVSYSNSINGNAYYVEQLIWVIIFPSTTQGGQYGIQINSESENFSLITDSSRFTKVVWKGDVFIPVEGISPSDVNPAFNSNMLCFFYWEDGNITMGQTYDDTKWQSSWLSYGRYFAFNSGGGRTSLNAKMVIFGEKPVTQNKYGFEIYNPNGELVYGIADEVFREPEMVNLSLLGMDREVALRNIKRPLINPRSIGGRLYPFTDYYQVDRAYYDVSFANTGTSLIVRQSFRDDVIRGRHNEGNFFSRIPFPVFDASNYFNFGG